MARRWGGCRCNNAQLGPRNAIIWSHCDRKRAKLFVPAPMVSSVFWRTHVLSSHSVVEYSDQGGGILQRRPKMYQSGSESLEAATNQMSSRR